jgi:GT2 family glycosyltransferase
MTSKTPAVSIIIPTLDGVRGGNVVRLMDQLRAQTYTDFEIILVKNVRPNGKARNEGARQAKGKILICIDDDVRLGHAKVIENLVRIVSSHDHIGLAGISKLIPENSNWFQRKCSQEIPRSTSPIYAQLTDGDLVDHMCMAIRKDLFFAVQMENEDLIRGTDPDLRNRIRKAGYRIAIAPYCWGYHPMPATLAQLLKTFFRNGMGSAWVQRHYPDLAFHDAEEHTTPFKAQTPRWHRMACFAWSQLRSMVRGHFFYFAARLSYAAGFVYAFLSQKSGDPWFDKMQKEAT